ncbi:MAG: ANTAR domain-containing protein [Clostridiales bacterium]|nr:ANTAR domain-containing protein [Clostridiales bacterium]
MSDGKTLLVCPQGRGADKLKQLLIEGVSKDTLVASSAGQARQQAGQMNVSLVIINAPLGDETGLELAMELTQESMAAVVLIIKAELVSMIYDHATQAGVLVVSKPIIPQVFQQTLQIALATQKRMQLLNKENEKLHAKLEEMRVVARAKCLLIEHMHISEEEAHRAIEKQAMDLRLPRVRVAKELIARFEL